MALPFALPPPLLPWGRPARKGELGPGDWGVPAGLNDSSESGVRRVSTLPPGGDLIDSCSSASLASGSFSTILLFPPSPSIGSRFCIILLLLERDILVCSLSFWSRTVSRLDRTFPLEELEILRCGCWEIGKDGGWGSDLS